MCIIILKILQILASILKSNFIQKESISQAITINQVTFLNQKVLCQFEDFWDMLDEIDCNTWILEPDHPSRSCRNRRIALGKS